MSSVQVTGFDSQSVIVSRRDSQSSDSLTKDSVTIPISWLKHNDVTRRSAHHGQRTDTLEKISADEPEGETFIKRAFVQGDQLCVCLREGRKNMPTDLNDSTTSKTTAAEVLDVKPEPKHGQQSVVSPKETTVILVEDEPEVDGTCLIKVSLNDISQYGMRPKAEVTFVSPFGLSPKTCTGGVSQQQLIGGGSSAFDETKGDLQALNQDALSEAQFLHVRYSDIIDPTTGTPRYLQLMDQDTSNSTVRLEKRKMLGTLLSVLRTLTTSGLCFVDECPTGVTDDSIVRQLAYALAPTTGQSRTLYGETWSLESKPIVENGTTVKRNVGFSAEKVDLHQDLVYFESMPGIQVMHCQAFEPTITGGESFYVDAIAAAYELRSTHPEAFEILSTIPSAWMKDDPSRVPPAEYYFSSPIISVDHTGGAIYNLAQKLGINYNSNMGPSAITKVIWAPAFEAPLPLTTANGLLPPELVDAYYDAYRKYAAVLQYYKDTPGCRAWFKCRAGQTVLFNNARLLHGREGFKESKEGGRRFKGAYINIDDFLCALRTHETAFETLTGSVVDKSRGPFLNQSERF